MIYSTRRRISQVPGPQQHGKDGCRLDGATCCYGGRKLSELLSDGSFSLRRQNNLSKVREVESLHVCGCGKEPN